MLMVVDEVVGRTEQDRIAARTQCSCAQWNQAVMPTFIADTGGTVSCV